LKRLNRKKNLTRRKRLHESLESKIRRLMAAKNRGGQSRSHQYFKHHNFKYAEPRSYVEPKDETTSYSREKPEHSNVHESHHDNGIWMSLDQLREVDETFRKFAEAEEDKIEGFLDRVHEAGDVLLENNPEEPIDIEPELIQPTETSTEVPMPDKIDLTLADLESLARELTPETPIEKAEETEPENEYDY
jgi:hypothetical protein